MTSQVVSVAAPNYQASPIKRLRATKAVVEELRRALYDIVADMQPMTVRQVFYQATVKGIVEKTEAGYTKVQTDLVQMRKAGDLPYRWLADNTRWQRKPSSFDSVEEALQETARLYRKNLWASADSYVEVWLEKDALAGVIYTTTAGYDVPLMVARGYASLSFLHTAAEYINSLDVPTYIYHLGDYDPSVSMQEKKSRKRLERWRRMPKLTSSALPSSLGKSKSGTFLPDRQRSQILVQRHLATSRWNSTRSIPTASVRW